MGDMEARAQLKALKAAMRAKGREGLRQEPTAKERAKRGAWLAEAVAKPWARGKGRRTPLMVAAIEGWSEAIEPLLAARSDPEAVDEAGWTPLMLAAAAGHAEAVEALLPACDPGRRDGEGWDAFMCAAFAGHPEAVEALGPFADMEARDARGRDALMLAAGGLGAFQEDVVEMLAGAADRANVDEQGRDALMSAAAAGNGGALAILLAAGDPERKAKNGWTALDFAAGAHSLECVEMLLPRMDDPKAKAKCLGAAKVAAGIRLPSGPPCVDLLRSCAEAAGLRASLGRASQAPGGRGPRRAL